MFIAKTSPNAKNSDLLSTSVDGDPWAACSNTWPPLQWRLVAVQNQRVWVARGWKEQWSFPAILAIHMSNLEIEMSLLGKPTNSNIKLY